MTPEEKALLAAIVNALDEIVEHHGAYGREEVVRAVGIVHGLAHGLLQPSLPPDQDEDGK